MKEIKFRAWKHTYTPSGSPDIGEMIYDIKLGNSIWNSEDIEINKILKEIPRLMQYTGLKDKNGVEIYEGDIIKCFGDIACIYYDNKCALFRYKYKSGNETYMEILGTHCFEHFEVIGNIYENLELTEDIK